MGSSLDCLVGLAKELFHTSIGRSCQRTRSHMPFCSRSPYGSVSLDKSSVRLLAVSSSFSIDSISVSGSGFCSCQPEQKDNEVTTFCSTSIYSSALNEDVVQAPSHVTEEKIGVLLLNLGGPETLDDVQPFLYNLFADPVCPLNWYFSVQFDAVIALKFNLILWLFYPI